MNNRLLKALQENHWAMDPVVLDQLSVIVLRHASGEKLAEDEIARIVAARGDDEGEGALQVRDGVAIIPIHGVITKGSKSVDRVSQPRGTATGEIQTNISRALMMPDVTSMVLDIDSPGGSVKGIEDTANAIFKARKKKPIVAFASDMTASAAYWLGSQATTFVGNATAAVGSIGVYMVVVDSSEAATKAGFSFHKIATGAFKGAGEPGTPITEDHIAAFQTEVDDILDVFTKQISRGRGMARGDVRQLADGRVWIGKEAVKVGLIDKLGSLQDAMNTARDIASGGSRRSSAQVVLRSAVLDDSVAGQSQMVATVSDIAATEVVVAANTSQQMEVIDMGKEPNETTAQTGDSTAATSAESAVNAPVIDEKTVASKAMAEERARIKEIRAIAAKMELPDSWSEGHIDGGTNIADVRTDAIDSIAKTTPTIRVGDDLNKTTVADAVEDAIALRAGNPLLDEDGKPRKPHERAREFRGMTMCESARKFLECHGVDTTGWTREQVARNCFRFGNTSPGIVAAGSPWGNTAGDYPKILENIVTKRLRAAYVENTGTWAIPGLMRRRTLPDFKQASVVALGNAVNLKRVHEGADYEEVTLPESREKYQLLKYGMLYSLTWEQMVNDDTDAFSRIPQLHGAAAARLENVQAWDPITTAALGATLNDDSKTIFHADHSNLVASGGAPSTATLAVGRQNLREQTAPTSDGSTAYLNLTPSFMVVPPDLEQVARELVETTFKSDASIAGVVNVNQGLQVVVEPLIGTVPTHGGAGWYLFANTSQIDTIEVAFLEGNEAPFLDAEDGFTSDGRRYKVRHVVASKAIDYRGMWMNDGA